MKIAVYPGSFDPATYGHLDVIRRAAVSFDKVIVGVLHNSSKSPLFSVQERVNILEKATRDVPNVEVKPFEGLSVNFARENHAQVIIRGLRAVTDFEYELQMAQTNRVLAPDVDTVFLTTSLEYAYLSSTILKEVAHFGGDLSKFAPAEITDAGSDLQHAAEKMNRWQQQEPGRQEPDPPQNSPHVPLRFPHQKICPEISWRIPQVRFHPAWLR